MARKGVFIAFIFASMVHGRLIAGLVRTTLHVAEVAYLDVY